MPADPTSRARFVRLAETGRPGIRISIDGAPASALEGDTLLVAVLGAGRRLRDCEFGSAARAGFCLMGACQDCWVWDDAGRRIRACTTSVADGMSIVTRAPDPDWPRRR